MAHAIQHPQAQRIVLQGLAGPEEITLLQRSSGSDEVFLIWHGITANNRFWFWDILWNRGSVWLAGLPGHGTIQHYPAEHYWRWSAEHFISVGERLAEMFAGRKLTLIGHSTGGLIALGIALRRPELVQRLILMSSVVWGEFSGIVGLWQRFASIPALLHIVVSTTLFGGRKSNAMFKASLLAFINQWQTFYANKNVINAVKNGFDDYQHTPMHGISGTMRVIHYSDLRPLIRANPYAGPTLLLHGTHDKIVPLKQAQWLHEHLPNSYLAKMPGIGHLPHGEHEPLFNKWITDWLELHPV